MYDFDHRPVLDLTEDGNVSLRWRCYHKACIWELDDELPKTWPLHQSSQGLVSSSYRRFQRYIHWRLKKVWGIRQQPIEADIISVEALNSSWLERGDRCVSTSPRKVYAIEDPLESYRPLEDRTWLLPSGTNLNRGKEMINSLTIKWKMKGKNGILLFVEFLKGLLEDRKWR